MGPDGSCVTHTSKLDTVNLKAAARRLGLHYQTAYRLVRSGDLIAIKVGAGYEISEAAIDRYLAGKQAIGAAATADPLQTAAARTVVRVSQPDTSVTQELEALMQVTTLSTRPVFDLVVHHLGETIGDFAVLRLLSEDRQWLVGAASHHHDPARRALIAAVLSQPMPVDVAYERDTLRGGTVHKVDFLRVDVARHLIPPAFQQYADRMTVYSMLTVPVLGDHHQPLGAITLARDLPGRPYTAAEETAAVEMAKWVAAAIERVDRFTTGWNARQTLHDRIEAFLADHRGHGGHGGDEVTEMVVALFDDTVPEALFDLDRQLVASNDAFAARLGLDPQAAPEQPFGELMTSACLTAGEDAIWARLISGETDYLDQLAEGCEVGCPIADGVHWAVAHWPDATPAYVIATCSLDPHSGPYLSGTTGERCWTTCQVQPRTTLHG